MRENSEIKVKSVTTDDLHATIIGYIKRNEVIIGEYEDMKDCILKMIRAYYIFNMDRDRLRDAMEDITYMLCPEDDINKDRVSRGLEYEYSSEEWNMYYLRLFIRHFIMWNIFVFYLDKYV